MEEKMLIIVLALLLGILFYLIYNFARQKSGRRDEPREEAVRERKKTLFLERPFLFTKRKGSGKRGEKLKKMIEEREQKIREKETEELFRLFELGERQALSYVELLKGIIKAHELRKEKKRALGNVFNRMEKILRESHGKARKLTETEAKDIFERLNEVIQKRGNRPKSF